MRADQIFIFTGPTIAPDAASTHLDAIYLPPVKFGDVYRITELFQPAVIGIVDGYFNQVPSVWHKEILWAMDQGVQVLGAASMGALRAAELADFGMMGHGKIFEAYQQGILLPYVDEAFEDDDEVAVTHSPAELAYQPLSEAMVNIRFSLAKAHQQNVIDQPTRDALIKIGKQLFYPQRSYSKMLKVAEQRGIPKNIVEPLGQWLEAHKVDQKKRDAINMLSNIATLEKSSTDQKSAKWPFQHTSQWQSAIDEIDQSHRITHPALHELRTRGPVYLKTLDQALSARLPAPPQSKKQENQDISKLHNAPDQLESHLGERWRHQSGQSKLSQLSANERDQILIHYLEQTGQIESLEQCGQAKQATLNTLEMPDINALSEIDLLQLADWYFSQHLGLDLPEQLESYAAQLGVDDMDEFYGMLLKEYYYQQQTHGDGKTRTST